MNSICAHFIDATLAHLNGFDLEWLAFIRGIWSHGVERIRDSRQREILIDVFVAESDASGYVSLAYPRKLDDDRLKPFIKLQYIKIGPKNESPCFPLTWMDLPIKQACAILKKFTKKITVDSRVIIADLSLENGLFSEIFRSLPKGVPVLDLMNVSVDSFDLSTFGHLKRLTYIQPKTDSGTAFVETLQLLPTDTFFLFTNEEGSVTKRLIEKWESTIPERSFNAVVAPRSHFGSQIPYFMNCTREVVDHPILKTAKRRVRHDILSKCSFLEFYCL